MFGPDCELILIENQEDKLHDWRDVASVAKILQPFGVGFGGTVASTSKHLIHDLVRCDRFVMCSVASVWRCPTHILINLRTAHYKLFHYSLSILKLPLKFILTYQINSI